MSKALLQRALAYVRWQAFGDCRTEGWEGPPPTAFDLDAALVAAIAQPAESEWLLTTTQDLAKSIAKRCYPNVPQFEVLDDLAGVISQIDNMTTGMERKAQPACLHDETERLGAIWTRCTQCGKKWADDAIAAPVAQPAVSDAEIETLAHRMASTYTHRTDPTSHAYGFITHTLIDFVRAIERLHGIGEPK